ncbi:AP-3 complex subunit delta [Knufia fluminis]|uniref:AP-3 complex subunit delta n=1 Tax=Knufia fluminis TaxID=191047 RepID=A0AAN8F556_9EURO|nr:AP-3 complex subunit delta [Knufia fluminis]
MFEKSLVDLIRGMRGHKGREGEYIQNAIKECRSEVRSQDMDVKATALLKLIYLEMFGNDMTWAAFNVLEVMSSAKHAQKRVGYLAAVQSFRPDTEVLMLAENLLKKDLTSPAIPILSLPLVTLPHIITSSLALSILSDLLPRLTHSQPAVRKKTLTTLYRLALIYPETLRVAWPKIKDRLLDDNEDSSVTAATVNVVCELGWRRPQDFLPLAPRLFELLIDGGNNWMAIKIIKLFAVLTPLEPRLVKKLVRPLTNLIQSTTAMSLLYECVSGIIQGGILDGADSGVNVEEVADLCISKLRGMIVLEGDPNLKYVALLAFNKIVATHPALVAMQQDVILRCLDDPDISIRLQALDLATGMVNSDNLQSVVDRLMKQLMNAPDEKQTRQNGAADQGDDTDLEQKLVADERGSDPSPVPNEYRFQIIDNILGMCSANTYASVTDFEWYIETLVKLIRQLPAKMADLATGGKDKTTELASRIGNQLLDIAVRVKELRPEAVKAAEILVLVSSRSTLFAAHGNGQDEVLKSAGWMCGEYAVYLSSPYEVVNSIVHDYTHALAPSTITTFVQAMTKVFSQIAKTTNQEWNASRKGMLALMLGRITTFLETLSAHPNLEVQERSVEFLELLKLCSEALSALPDDSLEAPLLLINALPELFEDAEIKPVSAAAQRKVPVPEDLDLDTPINPKLNEILQSSQSADAEEEDDEDIAAFNRFYYEREVAAPTVLQPTSRAQYIESDGDEPTSYQQAPESPTTKARRRAERAARNKDDPFYIPSGGNTPANEMSNIITRDQSDLDVDSIPIVDLKIDVSQLPQHHAPEKPKKKPKKKFVVAADETLDPSSEQLSSSFNERRAPRPISRALSNTGSSSSVPASQTRRNLLSVDSSSLGAFSLLDNSDQGGASQLEVERRLAEEAEMAAALKEVERKRLELARAEEQARTQVAEGVDEEGVVVKRKQKKVKKEKADEVADEPAEEAVKKKKKKKKVKREDGQAGDAQDGEQI